MNTFAYLNLKSPATQMTKRQLLFVISLHDYIMHIALLVTIVELQHLDISPSPIPSASCLYW